MERAWLLIAAAVLCQTLVDRWRPIPTRPAAATGSAVVEMGAEMGEATFRKRAGREGIGRAPKGRRPATTVLAGLALLALAGCAETELATHVAGLAVGGSEGHYKVGRPYRINGVLYHPREDYAYDEVGVASWYGPGFHGRRTANG